MELQFNFDRNHCERPSRNLCFVDTVHQWQTCFINNRGKNLIQKKNNTSLTFFMTTGSNTLYGNIMMKTSHNEKKYK